MSELFWRRLGYQRCQLCGSLVPVSYLVKGNCFTCRNKRCINCNSRKVIGFFKSKFFGRGWLCKWCNRKEDEELVCDVF